MIPAIGNPTFQNLYGMMTYPDGADYAGMFTMESAKKSPPIQHFAAVVMGNAHMVGISSIVKIAGVEKM